MEKVAMGLMDKYQQTLQVLSPSIFLAGHAISG